MTVGVNPYRKNLFYLQDSRNYVGNDMLFWSRGGQGYTTDLRNAEKYSLEDALKLHNMRETDIPWPCDYIDARTRPAVDFQCAKIVEALKNTGIVLKKPEKRRKSFYKCHACGRFLNEAEIFINGCANCGADNRP